MSFDRAKLFSSTQTTEKTITACGQSFPVHVRRLPAVDLRKFYAEMLSPDLEVRAAAGFEALAKAIRNEDGSQFASIEDLRKMLPEVISALTAAFTEINTQKPDTDLGNA